MAVRWSWMVIVVAACGPELATTGDDGSSTSSPGTADDASTTTTPSPTSPGDGPDPDAGTAPDPVTATTIATSLDSTSSDGSSTAAEESSTTDPFECGCPPNVPIEFDDELERGFTPADAIAAFDDLDRDFQWIAYDGQPTTMLHVDVAYDGGAVAQGPGGEDGCQFLSSPCEDGLVMDVVVTLTTDDGWLSWTTAAELHGVLGESLRLFSPEQPIDDNAGTLAAQPLVVGDRATMLMTLHVAAEDFAGEPIADFVVVDGQTANGPAQLGATP